MPVFAGEIQPPETSAAIAGGGTTTSCDEVS